MTVQTICTKLVTYFQDIYASGTNKYSNYLDPDLFTDSQDAAFLEEMVAELQTRLASKSTTMAEGVGVQEALAFIAAVSRADKGRTTTRIQRLCNSKNAVLNLAAPGGAIDSQLQHIGVKVEHEFIANV
jgi:hypothetical protein